MEPLEHLARQTARGARLKNTVSVGHQPSPLRICSRKARGLIFPWARSSCGVWRYSCSRDGEIHTCALCKAKRIICSGSPPKAKAEIRTLVSTTILGLVVVDPAADFLDCSFKVLRFQLKAFSPALTAASHGKHTYPSGLFCGKANIYPFLIRYVRASMTTSVFRNASRSCNLKKSSKI